MSSAFPCVHGFLAPVPLKVFLRTHFSLHVVITSVGSAHPVHDELRPVSPLVLAVPPLPFATFVYVSINAPPPPMAAQLLTGPSPPVIHVPSLTAAPIGSRCLSHAAWAIVFRALGPQGTGYLLAHCCVVVQLASGCGGLQILGPPLWEACGAAPLPSTKRARAPLGVGQGLSLRGGGKRRRLESAATSHLPPRPPPVSALWAANASRLPLLDEAMWSAVGSSIRPTREPIDAFRQLVVEAWHVKRKNVARMSGQMAEQRARTNDKHRYPTEQNESDGHRDQDAADALCTLRREASNRLCAAIDDCAIRRWFPVALHKPTVDHLPVPASACPIVSPDTSARHVTSSNGLAMHLQRVVRAFIGQLALRVDARGAVLRCRGPRYDAEAQQRRHPEERSSNSGRCLLSLESDASASVGVVLRFLRNVLETFEWSTEPSAESVTAVGNHPRTARATSSFWDRSAPCRRGGKKDPAQRRASGATETAAHATPVLDALLSAIGKWLAFGKRGTFPLHLFLDGVKVNQVPWLAGCAISGHPKQRGMTQQRIWLEFCLLLVSGPIPMLVREAFHVTWSPKAWNVLTFYHKEDFRALCRAEVALLRGPAPVAAHRRVLNRSLCDPLATTAPAGERHLPLALTPAASRRAVWKRAIGSPLRMQLLYSHIRFLPDGRKLRPIATVRLGHGQSLRNMAARWRRRMNGKAPANTNTDPAARQQRTRKMSSVAREHSSASPNRTILRDALECLVCGLKERRRVMGTPGASCRTHADEYRMWSCFMRSIQRLEAHETNNCDVPLADRGLQAAASPRVSAPRLYAVRGDASRCYDRLPQAQLLDTVRRLVSHRSYVKVPFVALTMESNPEGCHWWRHWSSVMTCDDVDSGFVRDIPQGWVVREVQQASWAVGGADQPFGTVTGGRRDVPSSAAAVAHFDGDHIRQVLAQHVREHFVVLDKRLYTQHCGITQGSAVAGLLCDAQLEDVDSDLAANLEMFDAPALLMRRVDDVLVVTTSSAGAASCASLLRRGWPDVGFVCNNEKLLVLPHDCEEPECATECQQCQQQRQVPWCGLLWDPSSYEFSVQWSRLLGDHARLSQAIRPRTEADVVLSMLRLVSALKIRTPMTVFCATLNSKARVLQTLCEMGLIFARGLVDKLVAGAGYLRPHVRCLLRPLHVATAAFQRHVERRGRELAVQGSCCALDATDVRLVMLAALHRTLQSSLRWILKMATPPAAPRMSALSVQPARAVGAELHVGHQPGDEDGAIFQGRRGSRPPATWSPRVWLTLLRLVQRQLDTLGDGTKTHRDAEAQSAFDATVATLRDHDILNAAYVAIAGQT